MAPLVGQPYPAAGPAGKKAASYWVMCSGAVGLLVDKTTHSPQFLPGSGRAEQEAAVRLRAAGQRFRDQYFKSEPEPARPFPPKLQQEARFGRCGGFW